MKENNWLYNNQEVKSIEDLGPKVVGFIYKITNLKTGMFYIGRKQLISTTNKKLGKKERAALPTKSGRKPTKKKVIKESNWIEYYGSSTPLLEDINKLGKKNFKREIIQLCHNKKQLSFYEIKFMILHNVLEVDNCYNSCVAAKYFKEDLVKPA